MNAFISRQQWQLGKVPSAADWVVRLLAVSVQFRSTHNSQQVTHRRGVFSPSVARTLCRLCDSLKGHMYCTVAHIVSNVRATPASENGACTRGSCHVGRPWEKHIWRSRPAAGPWGAGSLGPGLWYKHKLPVMYSSLLARLKWTMVAPYGSSCIGFSLPRAFAHRP